LVALDNFITCPVVALVVVGILGFLFVWFWPCVFVVPILTFVASVLLRVLIFSNYCLY
jgi:hypothetical protein